jgi:cytochrome c-type biogenesis protein CcmH
MRVLGLLVWLLLLPLAVYAQTAQPTTDDPVANKRAVYLAEELRCLVCQNQTIADSHAELAVDLRRQIREQIAQGRSDTQIIDYMVERYGDFVLYRPPLKATTLFLWFGPPVLLVFGFAFLFQYLKSRRQRVEVQQLSDSERREAQTLLGGAGEGERK